MVYYNDASSHSTSPVGGSGSSPFLGRVSASSTEVANTQTYAGQWNEARRPGPIVGPPSNVRPAVNHDRYHRSLFVDCWLTPEFPESLGSAVSRQTRSSYHDQSQCPGSRDGTFIPTLALELPSLRHCKDPFSFETLRNRVLTDHS